MLATIETWDNSPAVRLPDRIVREARLKSGDLLEMTVANGRLILRKPQRTYDLQEMLSKITPANRHRLIDFGRPQGGELL